jgi:hypothetical protein
VRVPEEAGNGKAKVTVSFVGWNAREVRPSTWEVTVGDRPPEKKDR